MKIIDLLNKIANGEEVPKKIKYDDDIYEYYYNEKNYTHFFIDHYNHLFDKDITQILDDEVEIIEEEKKASTLNDIRESYGLPRIEEKKIPEKIKDKYCSQISKVELAQKYNEIIDYLKSKGK